MLFDVRVGGSLRLCAAGIKKLGQVSSPFVDLLPGFAAWVLQPGLDIDIGDETGFGVPAALDVFMPVTDFVGRHDARHDSQQGDNNRPVHGLVPPLVTI